MRVPSGPTRTRSYLYHNSDYRPQPLRMVVLELTSFSGCSGRGKLRLRYFRASLATARAGETTAASSRPATKKKLSRENERPATPPARRQHGEFAPGSAGPGLQAAMRCRRSRGANFGIEISQLC